MHWHVEGLITSCQSNSSSGSSSDCLCGQGFVLVDCSNNTVQAALFPNWFCLPSNNTLLTSSPTNSPTSSPNTLSSNDLSSRSVAGGLGGTALVLATAFVVRLYSNRRRLTPGTNAPDEEWTEDEFNRFRLAYQKTHDFEELCKVVPSRSRESVAAKTRSLMAKSDGRIMSFFKATMLPLPLKRFKFVSERGRKLGFSTMKSSTNVGSIVHVNEIGGSTTTLDQDAIRSTMATQYTVTVRMNAGTQHTNYSTVSY